MIRTSKKKHVIGVISFMLFSTMIFTTCEIEDENIKKEPSAEKDNFWEHFIAHAGGAIDGLYYTNCLEAMDLSYSKGCKLFELDLVLSTDGKIIAKHDPPEVTEKEFMGKRIHGKYTPMNMESINRWFENHPDAILITDKINNPELIYLEFQFHDRLIMELFTWEAVDKAIQLGIKPMATGNLLFGKTESGKIRINFFVNFKTSAIEKILEKKGIEYISMSYKRIAWYKPLLKRLKNKGVKNYVFNLEKPIKGRKGEQYIWEKRMDYCYGMYVNDLDIFEYK